MKDLQSCMEKAQEKKAKKKKKKEGQALCIVMLLLFITSLFIYIKKCFSIFGNARSYEKLNIVFMSVLTFPLLPTLEAAGHRQPRYGQTFEICLSENESEQNNLEIQTYFSFIFDGL